MLYVREFNILYIIYIYKIYINIKVTLESRNQMLNHKIGLKIFVLMDHHFIKERDVQRTRYIM